MECAFNSKGLNMKQFFRAACIAVAITACNSVSANSVTEQSRSTTTDTENRKSKETARSGEHSVGLEHSLTPGQLFFPILAEIEQLSLEDLRGMYQQMVIDAENYKTEEGESSEELRRGYFELLKSFNLMRFYLWDVCKGAYTNSSKYVWSDDRNVVIRTTIGSVGGSISDTQRHMRESKNRIIEAVIEPEFTMLPLKSEQIFHNKTAEIIGQPDSQFKRLACLKASANSIEKAIHFLIRMGTKKGDMLVVNNLDESARLAFRSAGAFTPEYKLIKHYSFEGGFFAQYSDHLFPDANAIKCLVPTYNGIIRNMTTVRCGGYIFDGARPELIHHGRTLLSDDTINGIKYRFIDASTYRDLTKTATSSSTSDRVTKGKSQKAKVLERKQQ